MKLLKGAVLFLLLFISISTSFSDVGDPAEVQTPGTTAKLFVNESPSEIILTPSSLEMWVYPNRTTTAQFDVTTIRGNVNVTVQFNLIGNITDHPTLLTFRENPTKVGVVTTKTIILDIDSNNVPIGNYTANLTAIVLETGYNVTIPIIIYNVENVGHFIITILDEAGTRLSNSYIQLYQGLNFLEQGYTDRDGEYISRYYWLDRYFIIVASKTTYNSKATGRTMEEVDEYVNITLGGTARLAFYPNEYYTWMWVGDSETMQLLLYNYGNGKERWIYIDPSNNWLVPSPRYYDSLDPGVYRYINVQIGPFSHGGFYTGEIVADGFRSMATAKFFVTVYEIGSGGGGGGSVPPGGGTTPGVIIIPPSNLTIPGTTPDYLTEYPSLVIRTKPSVSLTIGIPYSLFVEVKNTGDVALNSLLLNVTGVEFSESHPRSYYSLQPGEKRLFVVRLMATNLTSGYLRVKADSKELETYIVIPYTVSIGEVDPNSLLSEINSFRQLLEAVDRELLQMFSNGYGVTGAFSLVSVVNDELNTAEDYWDKSEYYNTRKWLDIVIDDVDTLWHIIDIIKQKGPNRVSEVSMWLLLIIIFISVILLYYLRRSRRKKE